MKKDFEGQRKREHVKSISLLLSDFFHGRFRGCCMYSMERSCSA